MMRTNTIIPFQPHNDCERQRANHERDPYACACGRACGWERACVYVRVRTACQELTDIVSTPTQGRTTCNMQVSIESQCMLLVFLIHSQQIPILFPPIYF